MPLRNLALVVIAAAVLAALYAVVRPGPEPAAPAVAAAPAAVPAADATPVRRLSVDSPQATPLAVVQGERMVLEVASSRAGAINIHGLVADEFAVGPQAPARIDVVPATPGRYAVHFHGPKGEHLPVGALEVAARARP